MIRLNNQSPLGDILDEMWRKIELENPELAQEIRKIVDGNETKTLDFYAGYNQALLRAGQIFHVTMHSESSETKNYGLLLAYTEHQIRNT